MRAFNYFTERNEPRIGLEIEGKNYNFSYLWQIYKDFKGLHKIPDMIFLQMMVEMEYFFRENFEEVLNTVQSFRSLQDMVIRDKYRLDVPISRPQKIICIGKNYVEHAKEFNSSVPKEPMFFSKLPSALVPHGGKVVLPANVGRIDHEVELAVIIGKPATKVPQAKAMEYVAGYTIAVDVTARDVQKAAKNAGHPWTLAKGMDTFLPLGPYLLPADDVKDPHNLPIELRLNSSVKQKGNTRDMVFKIPELIEYITRYITLQPGDIICTGTPEGVSPLKDGDKMEAMIEGYGVLKNSVVER